MAIVRDGVGGRVCLGGRLSILNCGHLGPQTSQSLSLCRDSIERRPYSCYRLGIPHEALGVKEVASVFLQMSVRQDCGCCCDPHPSTGSGQHATADETPLQHDRSLARA